MIPNNPQRGFTLTEIMVALAISTILMAGVFTIMSSSKRTYALQNELSELQENARFVMDEFSREIRMAGYLGCNTVISDPFGGGLNDETLTDKDGNEFPPSDSLVIMTFGEMLIPNADDNFLDQVRPDIQLDSRSLLPTAGEVITINDCSDEGSKSYTVASVSGETITLNTAHKKTFSPVAIFMGSNTLGKKTVFYNNDMTPDTDGRIEVGATDPVPDACDVITISDDDGSHSYLVTGVSGKKLTLRPSPRPFSAPVTLIYRNPNAATVYKVDKTNNDSGFALYKCDNACDCGTDPNEILVEGVENMQIRYGIDIDNNKIPNLYATTPTIPGYTTVTRVSSIRVTLLMRTLQQRFDLDGATDKNFRLDPTLTYGETDGIYNPQTDKAASLESGYRHRLFTSTIKVRNLNN